MLDNELRESGPPEEEDNRYKCSVCSSKGFEPSVTGKGCTFCDGTEGGNPPEKETKYAR